MGEGAAAVAVSDNTHTTCEDPFVRLTIGTLILSKFIDILKLLERFDDVQVLAAKGTESSQPPPRTATHQALAPVPFPFRRPSHPSLPRRDSKTYRKYWTVFSEPACKQ